MEAALLHLIFNIAAVLVAEIAKHLGEHPFQGIILHLAARLFTGLNLLSGQKPTNSNSRKKLMQMP